MRDRISFTLIALSLLFSTSVLAAPKNIKDLLKISQDSRAKVANEKSFAKRAEKLRDLEKELQETLATFEKLNPVEGDEIEEQVAKFHYSIEPVMKLVEGKKPTPHDCAKVRHQVEFEDKGSRGEAAKLTPSAQEAMEWIDLLCLYRER